jgi:hypothetical protein
MSPRLSLRIAGGALSFLFLGHTIGAMLLAPSQGPEEDRLLESLAAYRFDVMGFTRSHADFYLGEGWFLSLAAFVMAALCFQLASLSSEHPALARRLVWLPLVFGLFGTLLCVMYFFTAPLAACAIASMACALAFAKLRDA